MQGLRYYESAFFSDWRGERVVGEVDPDYMYFDSALERIVKHFDIKKLRFIFILRNPVDRAFSHYLMTLRRGYENLTFEEALACESKRINISYRYKLHYSYRERGFYFQQIKRFLKYVDISRLHFLLTEDLLYEPVISLKNLFSFLNISSKYEYNSRMAKYRMSKTPRNMFFLNRIMGDGIEKKIIRLLVPKKKLRERIRQQLINMNETTRKKIVLNSATKFMLSDIYCEQNFLLGELIQRDLSYWDYRRKD